MRMDKCNKWWLPLLGLVALMCIPVTAWSQDGFRRLDSLIAVQPQIIVAKEARLNQMKEVLSGLTSPTDRYQAMKRLYEEYSAYQYDSAYAYVNACLNLAEKMENPSLINESRLNMAHILSTSCLMNQARESLNRIDTTLLSPSQLIQYYRTWADLLIYQAEYLQGTSYADKSVDELIGMRRRIAGLGGPADDVNYLISVAEGRADSHQLQQAIDLLAQLMKRYRSGDRLYSIITSTMSFHYSQMGDKDNQMLYLIKSAESDVEGCIRENTSLRMIADRLFDEGDIDRAYRYMRLAVDDANFYGTRLRNIQSSRIMPKILNAYQTKQDRNHRNMMWLLGIISVIALLLIGGVIAIYQLLRRYRRLNEQKKAINEQLRLVNGQLGDAVERLNESNGMLQEREKIKEEYIARFLALSSRFIDRGEE